MGLVIYELDRFLKNNSKGVKVERVEIKVILANHFENLKGKEI